MNKLLSEIFEQMADIMEILGENPFRINTYRKVARVVHDSGQDLEQMVKEDKLQSLAGVGKSSAEKIREFVQTGKIKAHQDLLAKVPEKLPELLQIPGFGPKGVALVWKKLGITNLDELEQAIVDRRLEQLAGFGPKKAEVIARGIKFLQKNQGRITLISAVAIAEVIASQLKRLATVKRVELAGSLRRCRETIGDIDMLVEAEAEKAEEIISRFQEIIGAKEVLAAGQTKASILFHEPNVSSDTVQVDLRVVPPESMGAAWQYFTGSQAHNVRVREIAVKKKMKLNEYGLFKGKKMVAGRTEAEIYKKLGMQYVPPTLREDRGEVELALEKALPPIVQRQDIRGDLHMHSPESDGRSSIEDLVTTAKVLGYKYIAITDHSQSTSIANGLDEKRLLKHARHIRQINESLDDFTLLAGSEVDILADGSLDYPDEVLAELDFVIASVHAGMSQPKNRLTDRILRAMENPYVNCIGHPTGRMINTREPMDLDMNAIIEQAVRTNTALEVNSHPLRLDLKDVHVRMAVEAGAKLLINTDAHDVTGLQLMQYGVATAQRGWAKKDDIINCQPIEKLQNWVKNKRQKASTGTHTG